MIRTMVLFVSFVSTMLWSVTDAANPFYGTKSKCAFQCPSQIRQRNVLAATAWTTRSNVDEFDVDKDNLLFCESVVSSSSSSSASPSSALDNTSYNLLSPREWLEFQEHRNGGVGGVYTVMRTDVSTDSQAKIRCKLWRKRFHLDRLLESHELLTDESIEENDKERLLRTSEIVMKTLRVKAMNESTVATSIDSQIADGIGNRLVQPMMMTILWQVESSGSIVVHGHLCDSTTNPLVYPQQYQPDPVTVSIASLDGKDSTAPCSLPNRWGAIPKAKASSWCRTRRPLEEAFKPLGVAEVVLTNSDGTLLLEGLTSNVFVLTKSGTLITPSDGVLHGVARSLVLEQANALGWQVNEGPVRLDDANDWDEVFLTSAVRLIVPVSRIVTVEADENGSDGDQRIERDLWVSNKSNVTKWRQLYDGLF